MEEEEGVVAVVLVLAVERLDPLARETEQLLVLRHHLRRRVAEVRQQSEVEVAVVVRQEAHLQRPQQILDVLWFGEQRRHDDERAPVGRYPLREVKPRQDFGLYEKGRQPVHDRDAERAGAKEDERAEWQQPPASGAEGDRLRQHRERHGRGDQPDRAQVEEEGHATRRSPQSLEGREADLGGALEQRDAPVDQVVADVSRPVLGAGLRLCGCGQVRRSLRHL